MCKFEQIGVCLQNESDTVKEAQCKFARSCEICCNRGLQIKCDQCAIAIAHKLTVAALNKEIES